MYRIDYWSPDLNKMGGCGFSITLYPEFKEKVKESEYTQENIDVVLKRMSPLWLTDHGFKPEYERIGVRWGEWGPEHIWVPGNACGLDLLSKSPGLHGEVSLQPHNIDSLKQCSLLLCVFVQIEKGIYFKTMKV